MIDDASDRFLSAAFTADSRSKWKKGVSGGTIHVGSSGKDWIVPSLDDRALVLVLLVPVSRSAAPAIMPFPSFVCSGSAMHWS